MLVDQKNVDDLLTMRREIKRLTNLIVTSLAERKGLKKRMDEMFDEVERGQMRLPYDDAEATERVPAVSNGNRNRQRRSAAAMA